MKPLSSNADLYQYLLELAGALEERGAKELSDLAAHAARCSAGMSTELLGESRIVLRRILAEETGILTSQERNDVKDVLRQLDNAFEQRR